MSEATQLPLHYCKQLSQTPLTLDKFPDMSQEIVCSQLDSKYYKEKSRELNFEALLVTSANVIVYIESQNLEADHISEDLLACKKKFGSAEIFSYDFKSAKHEIAINHDQIQDAIVSTMITVFSNIMTSDFTNVDQEADALKTNVKKIVKTSNEISKKLVKSSKNGTEDEKKKAEEIKNKVLNLSTQFNKLKKIVTDIKTRAETLYPPVLALNKPIDLIANLLFLQESDEWELTLKNKTDHYFREVEIWCIETKLKMHEFKLIEPQTRVKKIIKIQEGENIFYKNLVAQSEGKIISIAYCVKPIQIIRFEPLENNDYEIELKNMSSEIFNQLEVACSLLPDSFRTQNSDIKYEETTCARLRLTRPLNGCTFVVLDGLKIVSNPLEIKIDDEEEENEEEEKSA